MVKLSMTFASDWSNLIPSLSHRDPSLHPQLPIELVMKVHAWAIWLHNSTGVVMYQQREGWLSVGLSARVMSEPRKNAPGSLHQGKPPSLIQLI
jgi:hypothetical protein